MTLLVIDTQTLITNESLYKFDLFVSNVKRLISAARRYQVEVIYIRHDDGPGCELNRGSDGYEIYKEFQPQTQEKIFDKTVNSPFKEAGLLQYLRDKGENHLIITGIQTDYCIDATVKCAFEHGFCVTVPSYSNTTVDNEYMTGKSSYRYYNEFMWNGRYAECVSVEDTIKMMRQ